MASRLEENKVASQYAKALFEGAVEQDLVDPIFEDLKTVLALFNDLPQLDTFLSNPAIPQTEKVSFVEKQFKGKVHGWVFNLLRLLVDNDRVFALQSIGVRYEELLNEREQVAVAEVVTAVEIGKRLEGKLQKTLQSMFGLNQVILNKRVDPGILGGAIIKIQDKVIDGSFVGKLETLRKQVR